MSSVPKSKAVPSLPIPILARALHQAKRKAVKSWGHARGAVDALLLSLKRIGWSAKDATHFISDQAVEIPLLATSPKLLSKLLREAVQRSWQRKFAGSLRRQGWDAKRVCGDPARILTNSSWARQNPLEAHHAIKAFTGGTWTTERAASAGYKVDSMLCPLCNLAEDTLYHRIFCCTAAEAVCKRAKFRTTIAALDIEKADEMMRTRGIIGHPAVRPPPGEGRHTHVLGRYDP